MIAADPRYEWKEMHYGSSEKAHNEEPKSAVQKQDPLGGVIAADPRYVPNGFAYGTSEKAHN